MSESDGTNKMPVFSTGLRGLDSVLHGVRAGDNVVWQVETEDDYVPFVQPFCQHTLAAGKKLVYFRFACHRELVCDNSGAQICRLLPQKGFEYFITDVHKVIQQHGADAFYVFDSLSDLTIDCFSERMIGNFFMLTCPYLLRLGTLGYFMVLRHGHSHHAALPIERTTQLLLDVYRHEGNLYIQPLKAAQRYSPSMYMLHLWDGDTFRPVTESTMVSGVITSAPWYGLQSASYRMVGVWDRRFIEAEDILEAHNRGECSRETVGSVFNSQLKQIFSRDERILELARSYLSLPDLLHIWKRTIGSGLIGGKSVGMLLARAILRAADPSWNGTLEAHDSFFIGADIFYSFMVENGCWQIREKQKHIETLLDDAEKGRQMIMNGVFPDYIIQRFSDMLNYFGQCPIIVRSSSLLEDNFGNAFSGKYESVYCVNRGTHEERLEAFLGAVRRVYASTMSEGALVYRAKRGVLERDEQMALLVQRVSGIRYGELFFPQLAGVGVSFNSYAWDAEIDPEAGLLRLVFGLGTRAVDRHDDDYTRLVALNVPHKRPEGDAQKVRHYTQRKVDILDIKNNVLRSAYFQDVLQEARGLPFEMFSVPDDTVGDAYAQSAGEPPQILDFENVFNNTGLLEDMRGILKTLRKTYGCHVDVEFTAGINDDGTHRINLLQCRPLQVKSEIAASGQIPEVAPENLLLKINGGIIGPGRIITLDRIIYVIPSVYAQMPEGERHAVARLVGRLTHCDGAGNIGHIMLLGPGRWGTCMASLGVPVSFSEINTVSVICEMACMHERLAPDLSYGTHYFNDMVELGMLYMGFTPDRNGNIVNEKLLTGWPNRTAELIADAGTLAQAVRVIDRRDADENNEIRLHADSVGQQALLYVAR